MNYIRENQKTKQCNKVDNKQITLQGMLVHIRVTGYEHADPFKNKNKSCKFVSYR